MRERQLLRHALPNWKRLEARRRDRLAFLVDSSSWSIDFLSAAAVVTTKPNAYLLQLLIH